MSSSVAVIDIGKTNKKVAVYDDNLRPLAVRKRNIETIRSGGLELEDLETIVRWLLEQLRQLAASHPIRGIAVTTHGSALVCLDEGGRPSVPPISYTNEVEEAVHLRFWAAMGDPKEIQKRTATAEVKPLTNLGKLLWFLKERWPEDFARTRSILFYPQYFGYRLTGRIAADITYAGCHSYLWDFARRDWSEVADRLNIRAMLPERPLSPTDLLGPISPAAAEATSLPRDVKVAVGLHDSNSSLVPYLITQERDFVLNSTGTWCVAMHPVKTVKFEPGELGKMVFYNLSYKGDPVKTSILLGGMEYAVYAEALMARHGRDDWPEFDPGVFADLLSRPRTFLLPSIVPGSGQFPDSVARVLDEGREYAVSDIIRGRCLPPAFDDYRAGFALANLSLAIQSSVALRRVGLEPGTEVFIEGGFRQNPNYGALLGALLPENPLFLTALEEATSFGAALVAKAMTDGVAVESLRDRVALNKRPVASAALPGLENYVAAFLAHLED